ncbi:MAG: hypothetical protein ACRCTI_10885, partial [Beijerinckiaceae bacterium]
EGAIATFEVKTSIRTHQKIKEIGENIRSVRDLVPTLNKGIQMGDLSWPPDRILTSVITYDGAQLYKIEKWLQILSDSDKPDIYLDLSKGIILKNETVFDPIDVSTSPYFVVGDASTGLARFLTILSKITGVVLLRGVDWRKYIG